MRFKVFLFENEHVKLIYFPENKRDEVNLMPF